MSMTKREQAEMEYLRQQLRMARALRFTPKVEPDVPIPNGGFNLSKGFLYNAYRGVGVTNAGCVELACSSSVGHAFGQNDRTTTQGPMRLYSTRLLALKALRNEAERQSCEWLAAIDKAIEEEGGAV